MFEIALPNVTQRSSTGTMPSSEQIEDLLDLTYLKYRNHADGTIADYIPILKQADPHWFGITVAQPNGKTFTRGDIDITFSIQSISKAFTFALACERFGHDYVHQRIGVNNTGLPFNSVIALELNDGGPMNPMVNAGAIATTALLCGPDPHVGWDDIQLGLSEFAGRSLTIDQSVYRSESTTNHRNRAIAQLLESYGNLEASPAAAVDVYTKQCSLTVTATDIAVMGATLAAGGVNPITGRRVVSAETARDTLSLLATCGMYERSGEWLFEIGMPAKSGVSGGIVAVAPGKGAIGVFSPKLDSAGNSIRGQRVCAHLSRALGLNLFASASESDTVHGPPELTDIEAEFIDEDLDAELIECGLGADRQSADLQSADLVEAGLVEADLVEANLHTGATSVPRASSSSQTFMGAQAFASAFASDLRWSASAPHARPDWGTRHGYTY